jgi:hypothetical protein
VMQMELELGPESGQPRSLILIHHCDDDGLVQAALGTMSSPTTWAWYGILYDRLDAHDLGVSDVDVPTYDAQPETEIPPIERRAVDAAESREVIDAS